MCTACMAGAYGGQKVLHALELELWMVCVGAENPNPSPLQVQQMLLTQANFPAPKILTSEFVNSKGN